MMGLGFATIFEVGFDVGRIPTFFNRRNFRVNGLFPLCSLYRSSFDGAHGLRGGGEVGEELDMDFCTS